MRKRQVTYLITILVILAVSITAAAQSTIVDSMEFQGEAKVLTLDNAKEAVLKDNPLIKQSELDIEQAKIDSDKLKSQVKTAKNYYKDDGSVIYRQMVVLPGMTADFLTANAQRAYDATVIGLKADTEKIYYQLLQAEQMVSINLDNMQVSKDLYEKTNKKFELGLVAKQEVLNSELNYINAQNEYRASGNALKNAKMAFNTKLGYDVMTEVKLQDELKYNEYKPVGIAQAVSSALSNRMEIKAVEFTYESEKINTEYYEKMYTDINFNYREHKVKLDKAAKDLADANKNIEMEVRSYYLDVLQKQEEITAGEKSVALAQEALKITQATFDAGMAIATDVQKAQVTLQQAKLGLSKAILDYNLAVQKFEDSMGVGRKDASAAVAQ